MPIKEQILQLSGQQARIALLAISQGKSLEEAVEIAQTHMPAAQKALII